ncbi:hypothetical protein Unana1_07492 [Umbelopsis nana]
MLNDIVDNEDADAHIIDRSISIPNPPNRSLIIHNNASLSISIDDKLELDRVSDSESECSEHSTIHVQVETYSELDTIMQRLVNDSRSPPRHDAQFHLPHILPDIYPSDHHAMSPFNYLGRDMSPSELARPSISAIQLHVSYEDAMEVIMGKAQTDWCCLAFKISPLKIDTARNWRSRPKPIADGLAAITLATFIGQDCTEDFGMAAAAAFYRQASNRMDVLFDSMNADAVLAYFCLSYASNLMRLYDQQKTWASLASIALFHLTQNDDSQCTDLVRLCWCRWYYIDAWIGLSLNRPLLLSDNHPMHIPSLTELIQQRAVTNDDSLNLFHFAALGEVIRRAVSGLKTRSFFDPTAAPGHTLPSNAYIEFTNGHRRWFAMLQDAAVAERSGRRFVGPQKYNFKPKVDVHLHMSYHSIRLVILFQFLLPGRPPPEDMIIDTLETIFQLLSGLEYLTEIGCDQSTYHHMFFAIHNVAKMIFEYCEEEDSIKDIAREQLCLNNHLMRGTLAFEHDLFKLRFYGEKIDTDFEALDIEPRSEAMQTVDEFSFQVFRAGPIVRKQRPSTRRPKYRVKIKNQQIPKPKKPKATKAATDGE